MRQKGKVYPYTADFKSILIENGRIIDPSTNRDEIGSIAIANGKIVAVGTIPADFSAEKTIDANGNWIVPGLCDLNVHLREPGREDKETIETGTAAAAAGGFTAIAAMPDTDPITDSQAKIRYICYRSEKSPTKVYPLGAVTVRLEGEELAPFGEMTDAGARGVAGAGKPIAHTGMLKHAMNYAKNFDLTYFAHCEDTLLSGKGAMNESSLSSWMGLPGSPSIAEDIDVARSIAVAEYTGGKLHITHVSTKGAVDQIRFAKARGINVTAETAPHYFTYTENDLEGYIANRKLNPPLRGESDRAAIIEALVDGTLDAIASDHSPHTIEDKSGEFDHCRNGASGLETSLAASITALVNPGHLSPIELIRKLSTVPCAILGVEGGSLAIGSSADVAIIDPEQVWNVDTMQFYSKGRNSAFAGENLTGEVQFTILNGQIVFER